VNRPPVFKGAIEEKYLRHSDPDIPIQRFGFLLGRLLLIKPIDFYYD
jgi:hypothetical protein